MPIQERSIDELKKHASSVQQFAVSNVEESEILGNAHYDVESARSYKLKFKIEEKKKQEALRKSYAATIQSTINKNLRNDDLAIGSHSVKLANRRIGAVVESVK